MIINALIFILAWLTKALDLIAPEWYLPEQMIFTIRQGLEIVMFFNEIFPLQAILAIIMLFLSYKLALVLIRLIVGFIALIRGAGKPEI